MTEEAPRFLTEARVREVYRIHAEQTAAIYSLKTLPIMAMDAIKAMVQSPEERMNAVVESLSSAPVGALLAVGLEKHRIDSIAALIAMLGPEEARAQATELSTRSTAEGKNVFDQAWKFTRRDHALLHAVGVHHKDVGPIQPEEVDAVYRALDYILERDRFLRMAYRNAEARGKAMREDPAYWAEPAGPKRRDAEARQWLSRKRPAVLAGNRFGTTQAGLEFVEELYAAGALKVIVPAEAMDEDGDGLHSDSLRVKLPADPEARRKLFEISRREARREGLDQDVDSGQKELFLWWD
jgi:hypothetical protein